MPPDLGITLSLLDVERYQVPPGPDKPALHPADLALLGVSAIAAPPPPSLSAPVPSCPCRAPDAEAGPGRLRAQVPPAAPQQSGTVRRRGDAQTDP